MKVQINSSVKFLSSIIMDIHPKLELMILKVDIKKSTSSMSTISIGSFLSLLVGQKVIAIGNPFKLGQLVSSKVVSILNYKLGMRGNII